MSDAKTARPVKEPEPPFPEQHQAPPGIESMIDPAPRWRGERYKAARKLENMVAIVTGGDSGIGRSVAYHFAREGADVLITCLPEEQQDADMVQKAVLELGRKCLVLTGDLADPAFCAHVIQHANKKLGHIDVLVHNAAWQNRKDINDISEDELDTTMKVNVYAYLRLARACVPHLKPGSSIIATGSIVGLRGAPELSDYGATKGVIHAITRCLARELMDKQIRVNCVAPGPVWTPLNPADTGAEPEEIAEFGSDFASSPMGRPAQPEELAPAYVYLASNADSSYVTGVVLPVAGQPV